MESDYPIWLLIVLPEVNRFGYVLFASRNTPVLTETNIKISAYYINVRYTYYRVIKKTRDHYSNNY